MKQEEISEEELTALVGEKELERLKARIGVEFPCIPYHEEATKDAIRHWSHGVGDANPLWSDEEYAKKTKYGCIIAPPIFLNSTSSARYGREFGRGLPGWGDLHAGDEWEFFQVVRVGDRISSTSKFVDNVFRRSAYGGISAHHRFEILYRNQRGEVVAKRYALGIRTKRGTEETRKKYTEIKKPRYTEEELKAIDEAYLREEIRGSTPRYWEDVNVGDELTPLVKGPLTSTDMITFVQGWGGHFFFAHGIGRAYQRAHPGANVPDPETNMPDWPHRFHWDDSFARSVGLPGAVSYGAQSSAWIAHLLTNWMGDDGFLKKTNVVYSRPITIGDTVWVHGRVTSKDIHGSDHFVDFEVWIVSQRQEKVSRGSATIILPSRGDFS